MNEAGQSCWCCSNMSSLSSSMSNMWFTGSCMFSPILLIKPLPPNVDEMPLPESYLVGGSKPLSMLVCSSMFIIFIRFSFSSSDICESRLINELDFWPWFEVTFCTPRFCIFCESVLILTSDVL